MKAILVIILFIFPSVIFPASVNLGLKKLSAMNQGKIEVPTKGKPGFQLLSKEGTLPVEVSVFGKGDPAAVEKWGGKVQSKSGEYFTAVIPLNAIDAIAAEPGLENLLLGSPVQTYMNTARPFIDGDQAHNAGYTGNDVIVGIVDTGIDIAHPDFLSPYGLSRILYIWDQNSSTGKAPQGFDYGTEWTKSDIDGGRCDVTDPALHGTHVAGIAAGNGAMSQGYYQGVAPSANIVFVCLDFYNSTRILDAVNYIFWRAQQLGKPCVINLSIGFHWGTHTATDPYNQYLDNLLSDANYGKSGNIIVWAAGNEGDLAMHASDTIKVLLSTAITVNVQDTFLQMVFYYSNNAIVPFALVAPGGATNIGFTSGSNPYGINISYNQMKYTDDNIYMLEIDLYNVASGNWKVVFQSGAVGAATPVNGYLTTSYPNSEFVLPDPSGTVSTFSAQKDAIAVGSMVTKTGFTNYMQDYYESASLTLHDIAYYSSMGPTADGQQKPDISAPGSYIISTLSRTDAPPPGNTKVNDYYFGQQGTSMAAPVVTGIIAILLEKEPTLTVDQLRTLLANTAKASAPYKTDPGTWDNKFGYGVANLAQLLTTDASTPVFNAKVVNNVLNFSKATDNFTTVQFTANSSQINKNLSIKVYDQSGNMIQNLGDTTISGVEVIKYEWDGNDITGRKVSAGVYFIMVQVDGETVRYPVLVVN
ncbi:MAG: S8 family serine peptidase [Brevinematales bacterium]|nr:S8 family serine peptidase [Brevinematales bacterium]